MAGRMIDQRIADLAADVLLVVQTMSPRDLCTARLSTGTRVWRTGSAYEISHEYPRPPLRGHLGTHPSDDEDECVDCGEFLDWREQYEAKAAAVGQPPLPLMVAPDELFRNGFRQVDVFNATRAEWLELVAAMIEAAQPTS